MDGSPGIFPVQVGAGDLVEKRRRLRRLLCKLLVLVVRLYWLEQPLVLEFRL